eukprot:Skav215094  [mRNA]  locus=scaffold1068:127730:130811:- [translate_table: standard]
MCLYLDRARKAMRVQRVTYSLWVSLARMHSPSAFMVCLRGYAKSTAASSTSAPWVFLATGSAFPLW